MGNNTFNLDQGFLKTLTDFYYESITIDLENQELDRKRNPGVDWGLPELLSKRRTQLYEKGHPWQNLIESQFGIQARIGEYHWERCPTIAAAVEFHRELIRDHNRLPHWAHQFRRDQKRTPLQVLGPAQGRLWNLPSCNALSGSVIASDVSMTADLCGSAAGKSILKKDWPKLLCNSPIGMESCERNIKITY